MFFQCAKIRNDTVYRLLEAWYWSVVFSGEYDKDLLLMNKVNEERYPKPVFLSQSKAREQER